MATSELRDTRPATDHPLTDAASRRIPALDTLRALGLIAVVAYHVAPTAFPGGFAGVDLFFVISGFLITTLLVGEHAATGRIAYGAFMARRARRLLPPAAVLIVVITLVAVAVGGDILVGLPAQLLGVATFSNNWQQLFAGTDYFAQNRTGLFDNFWSLAIEEQFYLLWPIVLIIALRGGRSISGGWLWLGAAVAAVVPLALGATGHLDAAYLATPAHAFGLLVGAGLAVTARGSRIVPSNAGVRVAWTGIGVVAVLAFATLAVSPFAATPTQRPLVTVIGSLLGGVLVLAAVRGTARAGAVMDSSVLGWLGRRSYAAYLWHLPLIVLADAVLPRVADLGTLPGRLAAVMLAVPLAAASYRLIEVPIRRRGFRTAIRRPASLAATALVVVGLVGSTAAAVHAAPAETTAQRNVTAGAEDATAPSEDATSAATTPNAVDGSTMIAIGDSVMLASKYELTQTFPGITVDAVESRQLVKAPALVASHLHEDPAAKTVVIGLGVNGVGGTSDLDAAIKAAGDRQVILVDVSAPVAWESTINADIEQAASSHDNVQVADWRSEARAHPELIASDGIHPGDAGGKLYAASIRAALEAGR